MKKCLCRVYLCVWRRAEGSHWFLQTLLPPGLFRCRAVAFFSTLGDLTSWVYCLRCLRLVSPLPKLPIDLGCRLASESDDWSVDQSRCSVISSLEKTFFLWVEKGVWERLDFFYHSSFLHFEPSVMWRAGTACVFRTCSHSRKQNNVSQNYLSVQRLRRAPCFLWFNIARWIFQSPVVCL